MTKVYFMIYDMGGGHRSTANALKEVIARQGLPWQVEIVEVLRDIFGITYPQFLYNHLVLKQKWAKVINDSISVPLFKLQIRLFHQVWRQRLRQYWRKQQPDLVVSLMPLVNRVLGESLRLECPDIPFVTSITDFADYPPHFWLEPQEQFLICPSHRAVQQAKSLGHNADKIFQTSGVVIHPRFNQSLTIANITQSQRQSERQRLGLKPDLPTGLVIFGSHGSQEMIEIVDRLEQSALPIQLILICGRNQALADVLRQRSRRLPYFVEGFTPNIPDYMCLADFFIGKPGSVGISEAIAMNLPVITECNSVTTLFQERASADWLTENGLGLVVKDFREINHAVAQMIEPDTFARYQAQVAAYQNQAVFEVANYLENILNNCHQTMKIDNATPIKMLLR
jgi:Monogalactosyldiacylglycerol (MGDG) synthase/Glycosyltransferase family 28 C-terminal domain